MVKYIQSRPGYVIKITDEGSTRLSLGEYLKLVETGVVQTNIVYNIKRFHKAYQAELALLQKLHRDEKAKIKAKEAKDKPEAPQTVPDDSQQLKTTEE